MIWKKKEKKGRDIILRMIFYDFVYLEQLGEIGKSIVYITVMPRQKFQNLNEGLSNLQSSQDV